MSRSTLVMRVGLPSVIAIIGVVMIILGHGQYKSVFANRDSLLCALGVCLIIIAGMVALLDWLLQMSAESDSDRAKEDAAREQFLRTGRWPDDD